MLHKEASCQRGFADSEKRVGNIMDEFEELKPPHADKKLESWNISDLEAYITRLKAEIVKAEEAITQKNAVNQAAQALFSSSSSE